ncbi:hypothetical protein Sgleb_59720 [Streptomyces glebosus]|uniref:Uncharacterized protein n=1 Tax=Streptomyces glebosus TaxID=249580 RepID=A0A640T8E6_9ACTN|nr:MULTISPECIES: hypothetical protein [Streptomyces]KOG50692.1 hypothetical protein ADK74_00610 [Streptomyces decoyicus]QZY15172.1 hypothetical protein K7C20_07840 [Streptomyces decoyicus]GFE17925.1 hypothetical protein Sgleb_59720 [Streptomyces glebosus]GHG47068.1 hypothetical protein GCM10010513_03270 [Streptomyces glebosus]
MLSEDVRVHRTVLPPANPDNDPLLRLQAETQQSGEVHLRCTTHPEELAITGITVMCPRCSARRDWMVICDRNTVSIRCRCSHQWVEREISRQDFEGLIDSGGEYFPSLEAAAQSAGYDGTLAGTYLAERR